MHFVPVGFPQQKIHKTPVFLLLSKAKVCEPPNVRIWSLFAISGGELQVYYFYIYFDENLSHFLMVCHHSSEQVNQK